MEHRAEAEQIVEHLIDPPIVAEAIGVTEGTLARWRIEGRGPRAYKIGRNVMYRPSEVQQWVESRAMPRGAA